MRVYAAVVPLPSASCAADISGDTCCDSFWLLGERIRTVAFNGVGGCQEPECGDQEFVSFSTEGDIITWPPGESLIVSFARAGIATTSTTPAGNTRPIVVTRAEYKVQLLENGWPTVEGGSDITIPDYEQYHALSKYARGHAELMWRALVGAAATTSQTLALFPIASNPHVRNRGVRIGDLIPMPRPGPQIGYELNVTVDTALP